MKVGILITARLGSQRLKRKHLLQINGRPVLHYLLKRIGGAFAEEIGKGSAFLLIASSVQPENRAFEQLAQDGATVFYGSDSNIPLRHLEAARAHGLDAIIAVDGDDILCSVQGMRRLYQALQDGAGYVRTTGLPFGMNSFGYSADFLEGALTGQRRAILETGWGRIFNEKELVDIPMPSAVAGPALRFTLDYHDDFLFFQALIGKMGSRIYLASDGEILDAVMSEKLFLLNEELSRDYWENFRNNVRKEGGADD